jgi:hypothetical protein
MKIRIKIFFILLHLSAGQAVSQQPVQVVSTTWEQRFDWTDKTRLFINGEQADIFITTHKDADIKCTVVRSSRHTDKAQAESDLKMMKLLNDQSGRTITLRNYVEVAKGADRPEAKLKSTYRISLPENGGGTIEIWNYFGSVEVDAISADIKLKVEFSNVQLKAYSGNADLNMKYGDATLTDLSGTMVMITDRSNIDLQFLKGSADIQAQYARIRLLNMYDPKQLTINATRSEVFLDIPSKAQLGYQIQAENVDVNHPSGKKLTQITGADGSFKLSHTPRSGGVQADIHIHTGSINYIVQ